jgi:hypothetical protein
VSVQEQTKDQDKVHTPSVVDPAKAKDQTGNPALVVTAKPVLAYDVNPAPPNLGPVFVITTDQSEAPPIQVQFI